MIYAQLNSENIVEAVSNLSGEVDKTNLIELNEFDDSLLGKKYENGEFIEVEPIEVQTVE